MKFISTILVLFLIVHTSRAQSCSIKLSGHVEDADTKEKLQVATVIIRETAKEIVTDAAGDFVFTGLCAGEYTILITHPSCNPVERKITLTKDHHIDVWLPHSRQVLGVVKVDAQKGIANTGYKKELSGRALEETKGLSLAEALSKINGVTMLQTGSTISKPVIHGLHSNRILTINYGVRQEGQQWGNEHAPEIDPFIADKLIVIKGVDELRYGSDAIGGVILVEPKALRSKPGYAAEINTAYFSNNRQYVASALFEQQLKKQPAFSYRVQGTYKRGANVATPNYRLNNTGNEENNFSLTAGWKKEKFNTELFYSHFSGKMGIFTGAHIGNLTDLQNAINASRPNDVFLGQNTYKIQRPYQDVTHDLLKSKSFFYRGEHKFTVLLAAQFNRRKEFDIVRSSNNKKPQLDLSIYTLSEELSWEHPRKNNFSGVAGISMMQQDNSYRGRYFIPNYFAYSFGGYYIEKWSKHKWELLAGIRYDNKSINTTRLKFNRDTINYDFNFSTLASSFNAIYKPTNNWRLNTNISLANRAPFVNELLSDGIHHGTGTYEKGNLALVPERSLNISTGVNYQHPSNIFSIDLLLYSNRIRNFIYQQPRPNDPVLTIAGAFPLIEYKQTDAVLSGFDISTMVKPLPAVEWISKFSFLNARNKMLNDWLILMPANRFSNEITYQLKDGKKITNTYLSAEMMNVMQQKNVPGEENGKQDYKLPPPAYTLISLNASATVPVYKKPVTVSVGVRNLLNTVYRDYLNSMRYFTDEMGRNISLRLKIQL
ncbi:TonB-dependent receptor [Flavihumibacter sp.]|uniref:TonB-dependent receptor n=1 Tax=Flavihumibacter sp. TaxID=1913981 RepID=UPI002FC81415